MSFIYEDNPQLIVELKKLMLEKNISQKDLAASLDMIPQAFSKLLSKKILVLKMPKKY